MASVRHNADCGERWKESVCESGNWFSITKLYNAKCWGDVPDIFECAEHRHVHVNIHWWCKQNKWTVDHPKTTRHQNWILARDYTRYNLKLNTCANSQKRPLSKDTTPQQKSNRGQYIKQTKLRLHHFTGIICVLSEYQSFQYSVQLWKCFFFFIKLILSVNRSQRVSFWQHRTSSGQK